MSRPAMDKLLPLHPFPLPAWLPIRGMTQNAFPDRVFPDYKYWLGYRFYSQSITSLRLRHTHTHLLGAARKGWCRDRWGIQVLSFVRRVLCGRGHSSMGPRLMWTVDGTGGWGGGMHVPPPAVQMGLGCDRRRGGGREGGAVWSGGRGWYAGLTPFWCRWTGCRQEV